MDGEEADAGEGGGPSGGFRADVPVRALAVETHDDWLDEANRYPDMDFLKELRKEELRKAA